MAEQSERKQFEAWYIEHYTSYLPKTGGGEYCNMDTLLAWKSWQAALSAGCADGDAVPVAIPGGYVLMPCKLTAENGAKGLLSGEFAEHVEIHNSDYDADDAEGDEPETHRVDVPVEWDTIKRIYAMAVEHLAAPPANTSADGGKESASEARDAARYRWLRERHWNESTLFVVAGHHSIVRLGTDCPSDERLDDAIDEAIAGEKQG